MRIALMTCRAHHRFIEIEGEEVPGILVEGKPNLIEKGVSITNFFLPVINCHIVRYDTPTVNHDDFCIATQIGIYRNEKGGLFLGPNEDHNDKVLCFVELQDCEGIVVPKKKGPEFIKKVEFEDDDQFNDIYLVIVKKGTRSSIIVFDTRNKIIEHQFYYDYISGHIEHKFIKLSDE